MTIHLPPLFTIMGVAFASLLVGFIVYGVLGFIGLMGAFGGAWPEWPIRVAIPVGIITALVSSYFFWKLT